MAKAYRQERTNQTRALLSRQISQ